MPLCPSPIELELDQIAFRAPELVVSARARRRVVACPACGHATGRIHSRYRRTLADLLWHCPVGATRAARAALRPAVGAKLQRGTLRASHCPRGHTAPCSS